MNSWMWLVTLASLIGAVANANKKRWCFWIWAVTNACWTVYDAALGAWPQAALMLAYFGISIWGLIAWKPARKPAGPPPPSHPNCRCCVEYVTMTDDRTRE